MRLTHVNLSFIEIYTVKMVKMIVMYVAAIISVFLVGKVVRGVELTLTQWVVSGFVLLLGGILFLGIGAILSFFKNEKTASIFANIMYLGMSALGGLWFPTDQFPEWLQPISKLMPTFQFRELAVGYINHGKVPVASFGILAGYSLFFLLLASIINKKQKVDIRQ